MIRFFFSLLALTFTVLFILGSAFDRFKLYCQERTVPTIACRIHPDAPRGGIYTTAVSKNTSLHFLNCIVLK